MPAGQCLGDMGQGLACLACMFGSEAPDRMAWCHSGTPCHTDTPSLASHPTWQWDCRHLVAPLPLDPGKLLSLIWVTCPAPPPQLHAHAHLPHSYPSSPSRC